MTTFTTHQRHEISLSEDEHGYLIETRQWLPRPQAEVFQFFQEPRNLARITPRWLSFQMLDADEVRMEEGARIKYIIRWLGLPLPWTTIITGYQPPEWFEDTQQSGPYALWVHRHSFREAEGGTWVEDRVRYRLLLGWIGRAAHALLVRRQLRAIFQFRGLAIEELFGNAPEE